MWIFIKDGSYRVTEWCGFVLYVTFIKFRSVPVFSWNNGNFHGSMWITHYEDFLPLVISLQFKVKWPEKSLLSELKNNSLFLRRKVNSSRREKMIWAFKVSRRTILRYWIWVCLSHIQTHTHKTHNLLMILEL